MSKPYPPFSCARRWTPALRERFIDSLALSGTVARAVAICGLTRQSVYRLRQRDPGFAAEWDRAVAEFRAERERKSLAELACLIEQNLAKGVYDLRFFDLLVQVAGEELRGMVTLPNESSGHRNFCDSVSTGGVRPTAC